MTDIDSDSLLRFFWFLGNLCEELEEKGWGKYEWSIRPGPIERSILMEVRGIQSVHVEAGEFSKDVPVVQRNLNRMVALSDIARFRGGSDEAMRHEMVLFRAEMLRMPPLKVYETAAQRRERESRI